MGKKPPDSPDFTESQVSTRLAYDGGLLWICDSTNQGTVKNLPDRDAGGQDKKSNCQN